MPAIKGRYFLATLSCAQFAEQPTLSGDCVYLKGQKEIGAGGFEHWQFLCVFGKQVTLQQAKRHFHNSVHLELSRSSAANEYVWKEDTRVPGSQFELGELPKSRARKADWDAIFDDASRGNFNNIPKDILIRNYSAIKRIRVDSIKPQFRGDITVNVYWGKSGVGKTRRAWHEAGDDVYIKNPNTKWWDGYRGQKRVIIDEFVGRVDISYILTQLDRYPCIAEVKGFSVPLEATEFWITSNINPKDWYLDISHEQLCGLMRRLTNVVQMTEPWEPNLNLSDESIDLEDDLLSVLLSD